MPVKDATPVALTPRERAVLETWARGNRENPRKAERARIVLLAADGVGTRSIARAVGCTNGTASKWRVRFARDRLDGLADRPRPGAVRRYDAETDRRILGLLDRPPPGNRRVWTGALLSQTLGDVSDQYVWRFLRRRGIGQSDRRSWHLSTGSPFRARSLDLVTLFLHPGGCAYILTAQRGAGAGAARSGGFVRIPRGGMLAGLTSEGRQDDGAAFESALDASGNQRERRRPGGNPAFSLGHLIDAAAGDPASRRIVVVAEPGADTEAAGRHRNVQVSKAPDRSAWLGQLYLVLMLLVGAEGDPGSRLRADRLAAAVNDFLGRAAADCVPFIWGRSAGP